MGMLYFVPLSFPPLNAALVYALEKRFNADIDVASMRVRPLCSLSAEEIKITSKDGPAVIIKKGAFTYSLLDLFTAQRLGINCEFKDVTIYGKASILDLITDLLNMEIPEDIKFSEIRGSFFIGMEDTITKDLTGTSEEIRFNADGVTGKDNSINLRIHLLLNDSLSASIPKEIRNALLEKEDGPWASFSVLITGDYKKPSLKLLNKLFRLDITTK